MEGVGARLGRSSTRYGPATVFSGPVRKWKKTWVHVSSTASNPPPSNANGINNNASHLLLYKWTPTSQNNNNNGGKEDAAAAAAAATDEPPRRKFRYVPVSVIEEQKREAAEKADETKPNDADPSPAASKGDRSDGKPDVNNVPMEETQVSDKDHGAKELSETNLDLNLGLKSHDGDRDTDQKMMDQSESGRLERVSSDGDL